MLCYFLLYNKVNQLYVYIYPLPFDPPIPHHPTLLSHQITQHCLSTMKSESVSCSVMSDLTPWTVAQQAPLSMEFSRQEYWSGQPFPTPRDLPNPGIESSSPALQVDSLPSELPGKPQINYTPIYSKKFKKRMKL